MKKKIVGAGIEPKCEYCKNGSLAADGQHVLCTKTGILDLDFSCRKFVYDPLKRTPRHPNSTLEFSPEDFEL